MALRKASPRRNRRGRVFRRAQDKACLANPVRRSQASRCRVRRFSRLPAGLAVDRQSVRRRSGKLHKQLAR
jgi:hypothetical protein